MSVISLTDWPQKYTFTTGLPKIYPKPHFCEDIIEVEDKTKQKDALEYVLDLLV